MDPHPSDSCSADQRTAILHGARGPRPRPEGESSLERTPGPEVLGHFYLLETLGQGGCGIVYKAFDRKLQREVAIKRMLADLAASSPARKRFVREGRAAAAVRHENVVQVYAVEEADTPYLVMEYVPGASLHQVLQERGPLCVVEVLQIGSQVARGLQAAHERGLIHRDVKPANVLIEQTPGALRVKLTDFGIARSADDASQTHSGGVVGTPMYMSPEQAQGEALDCRSDLFSLGSVLYEMAAGRPPFRAANTLAVLKRVAEEKPRPIQEVVPETPDWLCAIIARLQARHPDDRFQTAGEVADLLERCLEDLNRIGIVHLPNRLPRRTGRWIIPVCVALVSFAGVAAVGSIFSPTAPDQAASSRADPPPVPPKSSDIHSNVLGMEFARIPRGQSRLGGGQGQNLGPSITIQADFFLGTCEVTREQWEKVLGPQSCPTPSPEQMPATEVARLPVSGVSWDDCQLFLAALNRQCPEPGWTYRLPQATEWEYACRGGPGVSDADLSCEFFAGSPATQARPDWINCKESGHGHPLPVGSLPPNRLGLHDLHGNVFELLHTGNGDTRWLTGGCWLDEGIKTRAGNFFGVHRTHRLPGAGLRVARVPSDPGSVLGFSLDPTTAAVIGALRKKNPRFRGEVSVQLTDGHLTELLFTNATNLTDLTAISQFRRLKVLALPGDGVHDLGPLRGLPLESLNVWGFQGDDLTPLQGMPLKFLNCGGGSKRLDLSPLKGMPLAILVLNHTAVDDLSPLTGMPLVDLGLNHTRVTDLAPLASLKSLKALHAEGVPLTDLTPIRDLPLETIRLNFHHRRDTEVLRAIRTLKTINDRPVAEVLPRP